MDKTTQSRLLRPRDLVRATNANDKNMTEAEFQ